MTRSYIVEIKILKHRPNFLKYREIEDFLRGVLHCKCSLIQMKLSIGIVGLPNVGKSTLFNLLTKQEVLVANYPFATIDPNVGIVPVPDKRLSQLTEISKSKKTIPAVVEFYDIAALVKGAHGAEGLGNQFLSHIREAQAIVHIVRCFSDENIIHVEHSVDPLRDLETINTELLMKDLETLNKRVAKAEGEAKTGDKQKVKDFEVLQSAQKFLAAVKFLKRFCIESRRLSLTILLWT